tara:strand:+ start:12 stop:743 length:732 start_codon:yes stop_codon:yes gene_type:complete
MTTKKIDENQIEYIWNPDFVDEFLEWFYDDGNSNPFIFDNYDAWEPHNKNEPPFIEFKFYRPDGKKSIVTIFNEKIFDIYEEDNFEEILESIDSQHKEITYIIEDELQLEPCSWYQSVFKKVGGKGYEELFTDLETLKQIPTDELPNAVKKNCQKRAKKLKDLVINHLSDSSKVCPWDRLIRDSIRYSVPYYPYMFELLPELGKAADRFKKDSSYYEKVNHITNIEAREAFKKANDNLKNNEK